MVFCAPQRGSQLLYICVSQGPVSAVQVVDPDALKKLLQEMQVTSDRQRSVAHALLLVVGMAAMLAKSWQL